MHKDIIKQIRSLFSGMDRVYGTYELTGVINHNGKAEGVAVTKFEKISDNIWSKHLSGEKGIGIVPISDDSTCRWGAIDIDNYNDLNKEELIDKIVEYKLPLTVCNSKSGGAHIFLFLSEPISAQFVQSKLREFASILGHAKNADGRNVEVFPMQTSVQSERGDIGSWLNMPYFNGLNEDCTRHAYSDSYKRLSLLEFIERAKLLSVDYETLSKIKFDLNDNEFDGAPPCLQVIIKQKCDIGARNNFMYALGVFAKKKFEDSWERKIEEWNHKYLQVPLSSSEIQATIKSLRKKDYCYPCKKEPIQNHCNATICRARKYGVGNDNNFPELNSLTKLLTSPPTFFWSGSYNNKAFSLELTTSELQSPILFQKKCIEYLNFMPQIPKKENWQMLVQEALDNVHEVTMPDDSSNIGQLLDYLEKFCSSKSAARTKEEVILGKPYSEDGYTYFRMTDFCSYLNRLNFKEFKSHQISAIVKENEGYMCEHVFWNIKGKGVNLWKIKTDISPTRLDIPKEITDNESPY